jgi:uncharacterized integral membrane protein
MLKEGEKANAPWAARFIVLQSFVVFDLSITLLSLSSMSNEGNVFARVFMEVLGFPAGLVLFSIIVTGILLLILRFCRHMFSNASGMVKTVGTIALDFSMAWFVAGVHFVGGTSWFWLAPELLRHFIGASIYFMVLTAFWLQSAGSRW